MAAKGGPKDEGAGRKKGTPNKRTQDLFLKCEELGCDPFEVLVRFAAGDWKGLGYESSTRVIGITRGDDPQPIEGDVITPELRMNASKEVCKYLHPQRKAIELDDKRAPRPIVIKRIDGAEVVFTTEEVEE